MKISPENIQITDISKHYPQIEKLDILRADLLHPVVSGNKWFKLQYYLQEAREQKKSIIASFGGAYSNHIAATAFAAKSLGFESMGFIRGEESATPSPTLIMARQAGMKIQYVNRSLYKDPSKISDQFIDENIYWIPEGGYGQLGMLGAATMLNTIDKDAYTHIICAVGTGTMMAGILQASLPKNVVIGISVLKNHLALSSEIEHLILPNSMSKKPKILHEYHFGGYAKQNPTLINFMNQFWKQTQVPTDIVYTSKLFYAMDDLIHNGYFGQNSRILAIHSGGLQGNLSLANHVLLYQ